MLTQRTEIRRSRVNVIARLGVSPINIHWTHLRRALSICVTDVVADWGPMSLIQGAFGVRTSLITNKSETCFILGRRQFSCRLESLWH
jgi:hypothetical protein